MMDFCVRTNGRSLFFFSGSISFKRLHFLCINVLGLAHIGSSGGIPEHNIVLKAADGSRGVLELT